MALFGKRDENLFFLLEESARIVVKGGDILIDVITDYKDLDAKMAQMTALESEGDYLIEALVLKLHKSFILPFDREDALKLAQELAATLDYITGIIDIMILYKTGHPDQKTREMAATLYEALVLQEKAFQLLRRLEQNKDTMLAYCEQIRQLEHKQDNYYRSALADLFENEKNAVNIIKWRGVYEHIEMGMDHVEDVADLLRSITIKYS